MKHQEFHHGEIVSLTADALCIPAGHYRFLEERGGIIRLAIDQVATVGLNADMWRGHLKPANYQESRFLSEREFSKEHTRLLESFDNQRAGCEGTQDNSYCMLFVGGGV